MELTSLKQCKKTISTLKSYIWSHADITNITMNTYTQTPQLTNPKHLSMV